MKNVRCLIPSTAAVTVAMAILATSGFAAAQTEGSHGTEPRVARRVIAGVEARLNITSEQRLEVKAILKAEEPTIAALAAQAKAEREAMGALSSYNEAEVRDIAEKYAATNTGIVVERAKIRLELRAVLTAQQLEQIEKFKARTGGHFEDRLDTLIGEI